MLGDEEEQTELCMMSLTIFSELGDAGYHAPISAAEEDEPHQPRVKSARKTIARFDPVVSERGGGG